MALQWAALRCLVSVPLVGAVALLLLAPAGAEVPPEVQSALDAHNARQAAESAKDAASIAKMVAAHSAKAVDNANEALKHAHSVIHAARVESKGLSPTQEDSLKRAEARLRATMSTLPPSVASSSLGDSARGHEQVLTDRVERLENKLKSANATASDGELTSMQEELRQLRHQLGEVSGMGQTDKTVEQMDKELQDLQDMLEQLEAAEAGRQMTPSGHDELKVEIEHLKAAIGRLKSYGSISATLPKKVKEAPQKGQLRYHMAYREQKPRVQLTPLADIEVAGNTHEENTADAASPIPAAAAAAPATAAVEATGDIDVDTEMPYGELEPFGREDTAQELTEASIRESDEMVDQLERAEVAEEKRAVFRALTRLRGAAITSFDGVARSQTGNIDEYNKVHKWRSTHPLRHLANEESDVSKWAFPDNAD